MMTNSIRVVGVTAGLVLAAGTAFAGPISLQFTSRYGSGLFDQGAAEIPAFDPSTNRAFVVNGAQARIDVLDVDNAGVLSFNSSLSIAGITASGKINSVAVKNGVLAVAVADNASNQNAGSVHFFNTSTGLSLGSTQVGALPDMLTFTPDGTKLLVANEGEPNSYGQANSVDPEGSVSIINLSFPVQGQVSIGSTSTAGFAGFNDQINNLRASGVRIFGPGATVAQDLEPEYIAVSPDGAKAYVTLQENNAVAIVDIATSTVTDIKPLGLKNHNLPGNGLDPSDRDGPGGAASINIRNEPVFGMYQPDAIASYTVNGQTYYITANEGDARDYTGFAEEIRVGDPAYQLDPTVFPNAAELKSNARLGRMSVTNTTGNVVEKVRQIQAFGGRSFSIWDSSMTQVFDSGDDIEVITANASPSNFNAGHTNNSLDDRSDNKGPEPEGVVIGEAFGLTLAFIGLERFGGILMYDVSNPTAPVFLDFINTRDFAVTPNQANLGLVGDLGAEGLVFVPASESPSGLPLLIVSYEVSGTTSVYTLVPAPGTGALMLGALGLAARRRR